MAYLGNAPARSFISFERQVFTIVNSQTAYTLSHSVTNENDIRLVVNNVVQEPGSGKAYTATGTTLTLSAALTNGTDEMYCVFLGRAVGTVNAPAASVGTSQLVDLNVTSGKIADDAVTLAKMASGTDGNIISYDASGNPVAVATGSAGQILTSAGAGAPPTFAAAAAGGKVISFASDMNMADFSTTSSSFVDVTDYYVDITPSNSNNNVLVLFNFNAYVPVGGEYYAARIKRTIGGSSTTIGHGTYGLAFARAVVAHDFWGGNSIMYLDSPNTTSSTRYQIQWSNAGSTGGAYLGANSSNANKLFAMELEV